MLTYDFDKGDGPLYEKLYRYIKEDIVSGLLKPGEKLPSKRTFAKNNGLSTITVQNAFDQLISEGYIFTIPKKGYYVDDLSGLAEVPKAANVFWDIKLPEKKHGYDIDLSNNQVDPNNFPFSIWNRLIRETMTGREKELMIPSPTGGIEELRVAIAEHLKSFRGMLVDPNQIVIGAGTEYLYGLLIQLLGNDKVYCIENPGYSKLAKIYEQYGIDCQYANMDEAGITIGELIKTKAQIAHISPTHHFPTGITMPASRRHEVLGWANMAEGRYIIEDDYDSEFRLNGRPVPTLFSIDGCGKVIYMNTFSKSLASTIRISYMVLPVHLINRFYERLSFYSCTVSNFEQYTLAAFIKRGYFEKHINRMRHFYARQRKQILECIEKSSLREYSNVIENDSGLHFILKLNTDISDSELIEKLRSKEINVRMLSDFYYKGKSESAHAILLNYSNIEPEKIGVACREIYGIIRK